MDFILVLIGLMLVVVGLLGCILPFLPGPPLCYGALLLQQLRKEPPFTSDFLWLWAGVTVLVIILEYIIPIYGTKKFGGSKISQWGSVVGLVVGFFFGPWGIIVGPFVGALLGELIVNPNLQLAIRAAFGSFVGFLLGTILKLIASGFMLYYFIRSWTNIDFSL